MHRLCCRPSLYVIVRFLHVNLSLFYRDIQHVIQWARSKQFFFKITYCMCLYLLHELVLVVPSTSFLCLLMCACLMPAAV